MRRTNNPTSEDYSESLDDRYLGMSGLTSTLEGIFLIFLFPLSLALYLITTHVEQKSLDEAIGLAATPLAVFLGFGGHRLLSKRQDDAPSNGESRVTTPSDKTSAILSAISGVGLFLIVVHRMLPNGDMKSLLGGSIVILTLLSILTLIGSPYILDYYAKLSSESRTDKPLPSLMQRCAWVIDTIVFLSLILLVTLFWALFAWLCDREWVHSTNFWLLIAGTSLFYFVQTL